MMPQPRWMAALLVLVLSPACSWPTGQDGTEPLRVRTDPPHLVLSNLGERPVYYYAYEEETAALSFFGACDDPESCAHVLPGEGIRLPYDSIEGYEQEAEVALIYWWHLVAQPGGGFRPDSSMRAERVRLR